MPVLWSQLVGFLNMLQDVKKHLTLLTYNMESQFVSRCCFSALTILGRCLLRILSCGIWHYLCIDTCKSWTICDQSPTAVTCLIPYFHPISFYLLSDFTLASGSKSKVDFPRLASSSPDYSPLLSLLSKPTWPDDLVVPIQEIDLSCLCWNE